MYLKRLEIQGFKSFADRVEFDFESGVTAIVGPNGSGKSNVVDSIRWVLGEQSAKSLRGGRMDDVIFAGSARRRPVGMAQVTLTLDNTKGLFPLEYSEVTVSRRLYRSGESEYLINKSPCRLKDIHELFMDTGLGREGFSIISQGKVDEILSLKPEDRRGLIEEAAGIIKYKYRKRDAERKLADTEENMVRLNDIAAELGQRVAPLGEQAEKARQYKVWKKELDDLEISLEVAQFERNNLEEKAYGARLAHSEDRLAQVSAQYAALTASAERDKLALQQMDNQLSSDQERFYALQNQLEKKENEISLASQLKASFAEQKQKLAEEVQYFHEESAKLSGEYDEKNQTYQAMLDGQKASEAAFRSLSQALEAKNQQIAQSQSRLEGLNDDSMRALQAEVHSNNELLRLNQQLESSEKRLTRMGERRLKLQNEQSRLDEQTEQLAAQIKDAEAEAFREKQQLQSEQAHLETLRAAQNQAQKAWQEAQSEYQRASSRRQALVELEEAGDGYQLGVKSVLEQKKSGRLTGIIGTVAQLIQVPDELERAIETALGQGLQNIVTENDQSAQKAIAYLKQAQKGRATFLPLNTIKGHKSAETLQDDAVLGLAVDLIAFDARYASVMAYLLGRVWVVKDLASAVRLGKAKGFNQRLVTLEGDVVTPGGAMTGGNYAKQRGGLLSRQRQIETLAQTALQWQAQAEVHRQENEAAEAAIGQHNERLETLRQESQSRQLALSELAQQQEQLQKERQRLQDDLALEDLDYHDLAAEIAHLAAEIKGEKDNAAKIAQDKAQLAQALSEHKRQLEAARQEQEHLRAQYQEEQVQKAADGQKQTMLAQQLADLRARLDESRRKAEEKAADIQDLARKDREKTAEISEAKAAVQQLNGQLQLEQQHLAALKTTRAERQQLLAAAEDDGRRLQKELEQRKEEKYQLDVALAKVRALKENSLRRLGQNFDCTLDEAFLRKVDIGDEKEAQKRTGKLKAAIQGLGSINFNAVNEYEEVKERLSFLTEQLDDLHKAKDGLDQVIKEMEEIMAKKFRETYQVVNETFAQVFSAMFGGGQARLELSDPHDYLLTGIEIIAQPPGKKEQILSLLSGGERAMTAIALLFALLTVRPSPFCILDEIEAALDEVNVDRFAHFIRDYTHKTQFIVISHRKGTMEAADALYGVTMENDGVSRLMSVKLNDYH